MNRAAPGLPVLAAILAALVVLHLFRLPAVPFDTDEAQHLHLIHGITLGELPYRDRFDNHTPLLHFALAPWMARTGEQVRIVRQARWILGAFPLLGLGLLALAAARIFGGEAAMWGAILPLSVPDWSLTALQVRPDQVLVFVVFLAIWLLTRHREFPRPWSWLVFGFLLGVGFLVSLKAIMFFGAAGLAAAVVGTAQARLPLPKLVLGGMAALAGFALPLAVAAWALAPLLPDAMFCLFKINSGATSQGEWRWIALPISLFLAIVAAGKCRDWRAAWVFALTLILAGLIFGGSPSLRKQTLLPLTPLVLTCAAAVVCARPGAMRRQALGLAALGFLIYGFIVAPPLRKALSQHEALLQAVINHVPAHATVMDTKGETIFRSRPTYFVNVGVVERQMRAGRLPETFVEDAVRRRTVFCTESVRHFRRKTREFFLENYVAMGNGLRVLASRVNSDGRVRIVIPGLYRSEDGQLVFDWPVGLNTAIPASPGTLFIAEPALSAFNSRPSFSGSKLEASR